LRLILFSSSSSSSVALLVLLVLLRRRGDDDDDVNASSLVLFPSMMISSTKDFDGFGVDETNATSRRQKKTTHFALCFMRVLYIYFSSDFSPWCLFRFRSEKRVRTNEEIFPPSLE